MGKKNKQLDALNEHIVSIGGLKLEKDFREQIEKWIKENLNKLTDEQLQTLADYTESALYENEYKEYI